MTAPNVPNILATRYAGADLAELWSPEHKVVLERELWLAVLRSQAALGIDVPDGAVEGYAVYRIKSEWEQGFPHGVVRVVEVFGTTPAAEREVWRFLFGIDLTEKVDAGPVDPATPLFLMVLTVVGAVGLFATWKYRYDDRMDELEAQRAAKIADRSRAA